jgi:hypothetical protein
MKTALFTYCDKTLSRHPDSRAVNEKKVQLVLCFGAKSIFQSENVFQLLKDRFPSATIATCTTSGEIYHTAVMDDTLSITAVEFDSTAIRSHEVAIGDFTDSYEAGKALINKFDQNDLSYVLVLSDGSKVNGSELVRGMNEIAQQKFLVTGGLAGDGSNFQSTLVGINNTPKEGLIAGIGFYGKNLQVKHGSKGGWEMFGLEKTVTRSSSNVLFEMDNKNALEMYKQYLGPEADSLPGSALLFPLAVKLPGVSEPIVRTILSIDDATGSMTFAGDIPVGSKVRFMKANFDKLTNAASGAAAQTQVNGDETPGLALLISCVGRKLILQSRIDEEVEAVNEIFGNKTLLTGFYSYGEISPLVAGNGCQLHNQTMTITTFHETEQAA